MDPKPRLVLAIPGAWQDRLELVRALARGGRYLLAGGVLTDQQTKKPLLATLTPRNPGLAADLARAAGRALPPAELRALEAHTHVLFLEHAGGSIAGAAEIMPIAKALLQAGGLAVQVQSSGRAHGPAEWSALTDDRGLRSLYDTYVRIGESGGRYSSCGMHLLGLRDAALEVQIEPREAQHLLERFLLYLLVENGQPKDGDAFSLGSRTPRYQLSQGPCTLAGPDDLHFNPFGIWRLR